MYLKRTDNVEVETLFSKCFTDGTVFYTCLIGKVVFSGFLRPEDTFRVEEVKPRIWHSLDEDGLMYSNMGFGVKNHEEYHKGEVKRLLKKDSTCCPSCLRRFRDFSFFE